MLKVSSTLINGVWIWPRSIVQNVRLSFPKVFQILFLDNFWLFFYCQLLHVHYANSQQGIYSFHRIATTIKPDNQSAHSITSNQKSRRASLRCPGGRRRRPGSCRWWWPCGGRGPAGSGPWRSSPGGRHRTPGRDDSGTHPTCPGGQTQGLRTGTMKEQNTG